MSNDIEAIQRHAGGAPSKLTQEQRFRAFYGMREADPTVSRAEFAREFGVAGFSVERSVKRLAEEFVEDPNLKVAYDNWKKDLANPKFFWKFSPDPNNPSKQIIVTPYENVRKFYESATANGLKKVTTILNEQERFWAMSGKRDPKSWTMEDWNRFASLNEPVVYRGKKGVGFTYKGEQYLLSDSNKFAYQVAIGYVAPTIKQTENRTKRLKQALKKRRIKIKVFIEEFKACIESPLVSENSKLVHLTHVTLGCREGYGGEKNPASLLWLNWNKVDFKRQTIDVFESKTGGGFYWEDCPLNLLGDHFNLTNKLRALWEQQGSPQEGRIFTMKPQELARVYDELANFYLKTYGAQRLGEPDVRPHYARKIHANILGNDMNIPLEMVAGERPKGICGVGWEDLTTLKEYYFTFKSTKIQQTLSKGQNRLQRILNGEQVNEE